MPAPAVAAPQEAAPAPAAVAPAATAQEAAPTPAPAAATQEVAPAPAPELNGMKVFPVERFVLKYGREHPIAPTPLELGAVVVTLGLEGKTYLESGHGVSVSLKLADTFGAEMRFSESALRQIFAALVNYLNGRGIYGVYVVPSREEIEIVTGQDLRPPENHNLTLVLWTSEVADVRTIAKGSRVAADAGISNPTHHQIAANSPLKAATTAAEHGSLFQKLQLDDYLRRLNRHPGRKVDAAISSTGESGRVTLDYLVNENRPWFVYAQISNTGTEATDIFRERVGIVHNQLFNRDDIASFDYITSNLSKANAVFGSYSFPIVYPDKLRVRGYGSWGDFNATVPPSSIAGAVDLPPDKFSGNSWLTGIELIASPWAVRNVAIDFVVGVAAQHISVKNDTAKLEGQADLLTPYFYLRSERDTDLYNFSASIGYETNLKNTATNELIKLGRSDASSDYRVVRAEFTGSFFLDPMFNHSVDEKQWSKSVLAHELAFSFRAQSALGQNRLIPQKEQAIGGFFTVRGYPESVVSGDSYYTASAEYRYHLPRAFRPASVKEDAGTHTAKQEDPNTLFGRPFNYRPPQPFARPDWDLILRGFIDTGYTEINLGTLPPRPEDRNHSLLSAGAGFELQVFRNLNFRADLGWVLREVKTGIDSFTGTTPTYLKGPNDVSNGSVNVHLLLTVVW